MVLFRSFSIPVVLKTIIDRFVDSYCAPNPGIRKPAENLPQQKPGPVVVPPPSSIHAVMPDIGSSGIELSLGAQQPPPIVARIIKTEPHFNVASPFPSTAPQTSSPSKPGSSKMEIMLKDKKASPGHAKEKSVTPDIPMDIDSHEKKMRELFEPNPRKKLRKPGDNSDKERAEKEAKALKRRASSSITPPGSVPAVTVKNELLDSSLEIQPRSEPTVTKIRLNRNADSPHESPTPIKLKLSVQPLGSDPSNPTFQATIVNNTKDTLQKKKKVRALNWHRFGVFTFRWDIDRSWIVL